MGVSGEESHHQFHLQQENPLMYPHPPTLQWPLHLCVPMPQTHRRPSGSLSPILHKGSGTTVRRPQRDLLLSPSPSSRPMTLNPGPADVHYVMIQSFTNANSAGKRVQTRLSRSQGTFVWVSLLTLVLFPVSLGCFLTLNKSLLYLLKFFINTY